MEKQMHPRRGSRVYRVKVDVGVFDVLLGTRLTYKIARSYLNNAYNAWKGYGWETHYKMNELSTKIGPVPVTLRIIEEKR